MSELSTLLSVGNWNTEWTLSSSVKGKMITKTLLSYQPDVVCITEGQADLLTSNMNSCSSEADHGYRRANQKDRKVVMFSHNPWRDIDVVGNPNLPPGRFVAATTDTPVGPIRFVGVCIPWRDAHVRSGTRDRVPWQDHKTYLTGLRTIIEHLPDDAIVLGDFNQRLPRKRQPREVEALQLDVLGDRLTVVTSGLISDVEDYSIDHLACGTGLKRASLTGIPKTQGGQKLSDHFGLIVKLARARNTEN